jgi:hydantoinase/carbamoylase family amidase
MFGSHIDSTTLGGRFDGTVGVVGALEVMNLLNQHQISTHRSLEMVVFAAEESARFGVSTLGSKATSGRLRRRHLKELWDENGITLWQAISRARLNPHGLATCVIRRGRVDSYVELHIEQGRVLESLGQRIGVVTAITAPTRGFVTVRGQADHSGATPMELRRDALTAGAELILGLERLARKEGIYGTVATVGTLKVLPGALNTIPGEVRFGTDIRSVDATSKHRLLKSFGKLISGVAKQRQVEVSWTLTANDPNPTRMAPRVVEQIMIACEELNIDAHLMPSGAIHDAQEVAAYSESGMVFVPSRGGISHNPKEYTALEEVCLGVDVLARAVFHLAV